MKNKTLKNLFSLSFAEIITRLVTFLLMIYVARVFGSGAFGQVAFAQIVSEYLALIIIFGMNTIGVREISRNKENTGWIVKKILSIRVLLFLLSLVVLFLIIYFMDFSGQQKVLVILYGISACLLALTDLGWVFNGLSMMGYTGMLKVYQRGIYFILTVLFLTFITNSVYVLPIAIMISAIATALIGIFLMERKIESFSFKQLFQNNINQYNLRANPLIKSSLMVFFSALMVKLYYNFDTVVLKMYQFDDEIIGWYNASYRLILLLATFSGIIVAVIFPLLSKLSNQNKKKLLTQSLQYMLMLILPIIIGGQILAREILVFLYGEEFGAASLSLIILLIALLFIYLNYALGHFLLSMNKERTFIIFVTIGAVFNVVSNIILIPHYGLVAAASTTIGAELIVFSGYMYHILKNNFLVIHANWILKIGTVMIIFAVLTYYVSMVTHLLITVLIGAFIYLLLIFLLRVITVEELKRLIK
ncbi:flippase [Aquibacillus halophilus]|uniref:flippase n=1 Tax=Aquibacillus halophilus TaxID=930132 RepID=UPI0014780DD6|nr:flippase [Aquibacillus halophilus]